MRIGGERRQEYARRKVGILGQFAQNCPVRRLGPADNSRDEGQRADANMDHNGEASGRRPRIYANTALVRRPLPFNYPMTHDDPNDVRAIYERLMVEVREPGAAVSYSDDAQLAELGRSAIVCAGSPAMGGRKSGALARKVRGTMFRLTRWYVEPFVLQQRSFNLAAVRYIAELERRIAELERERPSGDA
jgi:hypothetical protein